ncbi:MAG: hypothetical protein ACR2GB_01645 [Nocardioidaceae bacterium]
MSARPIPAASRGSRPGPPRVDFDLALVLPFLGLLVDLRVWLPDVPDRELVEPRDRDGEDVRVAMRRGYGKVTSVS